jgi:hypothetical protein
LKDFFLSIIDVIGILVPGFLFGLGVALLPPVTRRVLSTNLDYLVSHSIALVVTSIVVAYVLGFVIRLSAIRFMNTLTRRWWASKLKKRTRALDGAITQHLEMVDPILLRCLQNEPLSRSKGGVSDAARYFHFIKRVVRSGPATLWAEAERLEAEIRFVAGLVFPLMLFTIDGLWMAFSSEPWIGSSMLAISLLSLLIIFLEYPGRRIGEVIYVYYLGLIIMMGNKARSSGNDQVRE